MQATACFVFQCHGKQRRTLRHAADFKGNRISRHPIFTTLTAALAVLGGDYHLHGVPRMHERPIGDLVDALRIAGADVQYLGNENYPPLQIGKRQDNDERVIPIKGNVSSQFLTALLMALPLTGQAFEIHMVGELISKPYIDITLKLMAQFGVDIINEDYRVFKIPAGAKYHAPEHLYVEGDASSASYFLGAGLIAGTPIRVTGIGAHSIQGDVAFARELEKIGADVIWGENFVEISRPAERKIQAFDLDANHIPDAAMTLAIVALATKQPCTLRNIGSWRVKETDRIEAMKTEMAKLGYVLHDTNDSEMSWDGERCEVSDPIVIDTYKDHRMAMTFAPLSIKLGELFINNPEVVSKSYPHFWNDLQKAGFIIEEIK